MKVSRSMIFDYEQTLLGKQKNILSTYFTYNDQQNELLALALIRYAVETYLHWSPTEMRDYFSEEVIRKLALEEVMQYIRFPPELDASTDLFYFAWRIYPKTVTISKQDLILNVYKKVLDGRLTKFPKEFFTGMYGIVRAYVCLQYMLQSFFAFESIDAIYAFFAGRHISPALRKYKLLKVSSDLFDSPLEFLHEALPTEQKNEFLYHYYQFREQYERNTALCNYVKTSSLYS